MTKPFGIKEIVARARGLLRRKKTARSVIAVADASLDMDRLELSRGEKSVRLTAREADLLGHLAARSGTTIARDELLVRVWGYRDGTLQTRTIDVHVQQLRAKLVTLGVAGRIQTVRGRGYLFDPSESR
jgi:DNA-binding response OmpR family regulator